MTAMSKIRKKKNLHIGRCFGCKETKPLTEEHIIPEALGGTLSAFLLCKKCNSETGTQIDSVLERQLNSLCIQLGIKGRRGKRNNIIVTGLDTGEKFRVSQEGATLAKPKITINKQDNGQAYLEELRTSSEIEMSKILKGITRKYGIEALEGMTTTKVRGNLEYEREEVIGGPLSLRAIAKIAYTFLAKNRIDDKLFRETFDPIREYIFKNKDDDFVAINYIHTKFIDDWASGPIHAIDIHFDSMKRNVIGYIQLFGAIRFSVILAEICPWEIDEEDLTYCFDPVKKCKIPIREMFISNDVNIQEMRPIKNQTTDLMNHEFKTRMEMILKCRIFKSKGNPTVEVMNRNTEI